ncbi:MAG: proline--tRNA ligase [Clostridia bacterium]
MLMSKMVLQTVKQAPNDVTILSQSLMMRAGFIKSVANGIYTLTMPAQLACQNIENIIREEMNRIDGQEIKFPVVMPKELWEISGRYYSIGSEMARFKDRNGRDMLLGMTHEEAAVHLCKNLILSYAQLPSMIYQIQTKFRDEPRCRGGLIRVREFTMKDAYSFHMTQEDLDDYYYKVHYAYERIFQRIGMKRFISVKSDTGMMGGSVAHEFMLLTDVGEDTLVLCDACGYKANMEVADSKAVETSSTELEQSLEQVYTADAKDIEQVSKYLDITAEKTIKAVVYAVKGDNEKVIIAFVRGDKEVNEAKLKKVVKVNIVPWEADGESGIVAGNIGPIGLNKKIQVVYDKSIKNAVNMVVGANKADFHIKGFCTSRELKNAEFYDVIKVKEGELCPICGKPLHLENGIEIGNIFQLGTKYTTSMNMTVLNKEGKEINPIMGCYGIGVGRALASLIQESNDENGMILPISIAPFKAHICALRLDDENVSTETNKLYNSLKEKGISVLCDDRNVSAGVKFADADLMGMPIRIVISPKSLKNNEIEITLRKTRESYKIPLETASSYIENLILDMMKEYK